VRGGFFVPREETCRDHVTPEPREVLIASFQNAMFCEEAPCFRHGASILSASLNLFINMRRLGHMRLLTLTLATAALIAPLASANAAPPVRAGILQCQGGQNVGFVVGSVTSLECVFRSDGRRPEPYLAKVQRIGLDLGVTAQTQLSWAVNAPNTRLGRGELAGSYGGVGANASIGIGGGGNFLIGGPANAYALQPLSVQGQTGLNVAAGIAGLELQPVEFAPRRHHHHRRHHRRG
jgi:Protein of unknown function (DUF992)